ncbi:MAG TPA: response regulator transcription factor [Geobacteraceae bacterium]|nr:response regulator transcription factor [Geobacteraceae bacterium]
MKTVNILLADDHRIVLEGLRSLLEFEFDIVGTAEDGRSLVTMAKELRPDLIVADISMPLLNGIEAIRQIKKEYPRIKIVFLTMHTDLSYAVSAFEAGASGFVMKHSASTELITAIHQALLGHTYVSPMIAGELMNYYRSGSGQGKNPCEILSARQREVLQLLSEGRSAKEIASILNISVRTVEFHKYRLMEELGLKTIAELVKYAVKHGITTG